MVTIDFLGFLPLWQFYSQLLMCGEPGTMFWKGEKAKELWDWTYKEERVLISSQLMCTQLLKGSGIQVCKRLHQIFLNICFLVAVVCDKSQENGKLCPFPTSRTTHTELGHESQGSVPSFTITLLLTVYLCCSQRCDRCSCRCIQAAFKLVSSGPASRRELSLG